MIFDFTVLKVWHLWAMLGMFIAMYGILHGIVFRKPVSLRVHATGKPVYYTGWILALCIAIPSAIVLANVQLVIGLIGAMAMIVSIGRLDEERKISPQRQLFWQCIIAVWVIWWGWTIPHITNPFAVGVLVLPAIIGSIAACAWLIMMMNAMNFLDGTDGLASLVSLITCVALVAVSLLPATQDSTTLILACISLGAIGAFLVWNVPPAKMYLGTSGSWFLGLMIGMIAIIGGGKIATALTVLAVPLIDALFVIVHRIASGRAPWVGDTKRHVHHWLMDAGIGKWGILVIVGSMTAILGYIGVAAPTYVKLLVLGGATMMFFVTRFSTMKV